MNKKGLSDVVTTVLIILLVLAAIVIMWTFLRSFFITGGSQISSDQFSSNFDIPRNRVAVNDSDIVFDIKRNSGDSNITGFQINYIDSNKNSKTVRINTTLAALESLHIKQNYAAIGLINVTEITVAPIYLVDNREITGSITTTYKVGNEVEEETTPPPFCTPGSIQSGTTCLVCNPSGSAYVQDDSQCTSGNICNSGGACITPPPFCTAGAIQSGTVCLQCNGAGSAYVQNQSLCSSGSVCTSGGSCYTPTLYKYNASSSITNFYSGSPLVNINDTDTNTGTIWDQASTPPFKEFNMTMTFYQPVIINQIRIQAGQFNGNYNGPSVMELYVGNSLTGTPILVLNNRSVMGNDGWNGSVPYTFSTYNFANTQSSNVYIWNIRPSENVMGNIATGHTSLLDIQAYGN